jgi:hypothetical protein
LRKKIFNRKGRKEKEARQKTFNRKDRKAFAKVAKKVSERKVSENEVSEKKVSGILICFVNSAAVLCVLCG